MIPEKETFLTNKTSEIPQRIWVEFENNGQKQKRGYNELEIMVRGEKIKFNSVPSHEVISWKDLQKELGKILGCPPECVLGVSLIEPS